MITLIQDAIEINRISQRYAIDSLSHRQMSIELYAKEFKTVRINCGRRSGHTIAIAKMATKHDVVICNTTLMRDEFKYWNKELNVMSVHQCIRHPEALRGYEKYMTARYVFVDNASSYIDSHVMNSIYTSIHADLYILLG